MALFKNILIEEALLLESGIRIPKGTKAVKLLCHGDMDGFFSGLLAIKQLEKQGINKDNIKVDFVDYTDKSTEKFKTHGKQASVVVDFAALPDGVEPDFVSDHHSNFKGTLKHGKAGSLGRSKEDDERDKDKPDYKKKKDYKSDTEHISVAFAPNLASYGDIEAISRIDSANFSDLNDVLRLTTDFKKKGRLERLAIIINSTLSEIIKKNKPMTILLMKECQPSLVNVFVNIKKYKKFHSKQVEILDEMTKEDPDWGKIDALRKDIPHKMALDTSKEDLKGRKDFKSEEEWREYYKKNVEDSKTGYWSKNLNEKNKIDIAKEDVKVKAKEAEVKEKEAELAKFKETTTLDTKAKKPIIAKMNDEIAALKAELKAVKEGKKEVSNMDASYKSQITPVGNTMYQDAMATRDYPSRYISSSASYKGKRFPFTIKKFAGFLQVVKNPDFPKSVTDKIDLNEVSMEILREIRQKYETKYNKWAFDIIQKDSGGHPGITNIAGLNTLGLLSKPQRERLNELRSLKKRATSAGTSLKKIAEKRKIKTGSKDEELRALELAADKEAEEVRNKIIEDIIRKFFDKLNKFSIPTIEPLKRTVTDDKGKTTEVDDYKIDDGVKKQKDELERGVEKVSRELTGR